MLLYVLYNTLSNIYCVKDKSMLSRRNKVRMYLGKAIVATKQKVKASGLFGGQRHCGSGDVMLQDSTCLLPEHLALKQIACHIKKFEIGHIYPG